MAEKLAPGALELERTPPRATRATPPLEVEVDDDFAAFHANFHSPGSARKAQAPCSDADDDMAAFAAAFHSPGSKVRTATPGRSGLKKEVWALCIVLPVCVVSVCLSVSVSALCAVSIYVHVHVCVLSAARAVHALVCCVCAALMFCGCFRGRRTQWVGSLLLPLL